MIYILNISHHARQWPTPCPMLYGSRLLSYAPYSWRLQSGPTEWIIQRITRKRKSANLLIVFRVMNKFSYLILHIIHAYNAGISRLRSYARLQSEDTTPVVSTTLIVCSTPVGRRDSGRMSNSGRKTWLWSYARLRSKDMTLIVYPDSNCTSRLGWRHDSDRISWLGSCITTPVKEHATCLTNSYVNDYAWSS
jgi:hypothetical protein